MNPTLQLLQAYRDLSTAAAGFAETQPHTTDWLRARDRLREQCRRIHVLDAELAPVGTLYYRGQRA